MSSANIDPAAILNRALEYAAQNLRDREAADPARSRSVQHHLRCGVQSPAGHRAGEHQFRQHAGARRRGLLRRDADGAHDRAAAHHRHHQHRVLHRLWRAGRRGCDIPALSAVAADQRHPACVRCSPSSRRRGFRRRAICRWTGCGRS